MPQEHKEVVFGEKGASLSIKATAKKLFIEIGGDPLGFVYAFVSLIEKDPCMSIVMRSALEIHSAENPEMAKKDEDALSVVMKYIYEMMSLMTPEESKDLKCTCKSCKKQK